MPKLRFVNNLLLTLIILVNGYVILAPLWPAVNYGWQNHTGQKARFNTEIKRGLSQTQPQPNHVVIPSMLLNAPVYDGSVANQYKVLNQGIWRYPKAGSPDKGSNTVLIGHRFTYTNPRGIFYYLNKVKLNDEIGLWWNNKEYLYKVNQVNVVPPNDTAIEGPSDKPKLTLFTCTPLWLPKNRLVVVAQLEDRS